MRNLCFLNNQRHNRVSLVAQTLKNVSAMQETWIWSLSQEDPLEKGMTTHPSILTGKSHGQRSLEGATVHGVTKSQDTTERLTLSLSFKGTIRSSESIESLAKWNICYIGRVNIFQLVELISTWNKEVHHSWRNLLIFEYICSLLDSGLINKGKCTLSSK